MSFFEAMEQELAKEKSLTENGAVAYSSTGKEILDFNFSISSMRTMPENEIKRRFAKVYYENPLIAIKYLFFVGDVREGLGERKVFRACFDWLAENQPFQAILLLDFIPEYNRWDSVVRLIRNPDLVHGTTRMIKRQLERDIKNMKANKPVSLLAKWMPSRNASSEKTRELANIIRRRLGWKDAHYRKTLSALRNYIGVVETKMSSGEWDKIDYEKVPSKANLNYKDAFMRHDSERRIEYLKSLANGEKKMNAGVLQPHEICRTYREGHRVKDFDQTLEELWKNLPDISIENTLVVRDGSGSMTCSLCGKANGLDVSTALAIYMAEHNSGEWKNKYITFSAYPEIVDLSNCTTLRDKISLSMTKDDCSDTNIYKTMKLILDTAIENNMSQGDMPKTIVIVSDMQFNGYDFGIDQTLFENISKDFLEVGYHLPKICFWNLDNRSNKTVPMKKNELGIALVSGFSVQVLRMIMSGCIDPYEALIDILNSDRYLAVEERIKMFT